MPNFRNVACGRLEGLVKFRFLGRTHSDVTQQVCGSLRICILDRLPGDADAGPQ